MTRDRIMEVSRLAAERAADKRASAPASVKLINRAAELRRKHDAKDQQSKADLQYMRA